MIELTQHRQRLRNSQLSRVFSADEHLKFAPSAPMCVNRYRLAHEPGYVPALHNIALRISLSQSVT